MTRLVLFSYWRSSASYRVRIALALKNLSYDYRAVHLLRDGGEQNHASYRALNPQGRVPLLVHGELRIAQSLAILDYLEALQPTPALLPADAALRARMLSFCHSIAADIQPLQNTSVLQRLGALGLSAQQREEWGRQWIARGLVALEAETQDLPLHDFCFGAQATWADCLLVPQVFNAERFDCDLTQFPRLYALAQRLREHPAFQAAQPARQPDADT